MAVNVSLAIDDHQRVSPPPGKYQFSAVVGVQLIVCGGMIEGANRKVREALSLRNVYTFNFCLEHWTKHSASGDYPNTMLYCGASIGMDQFFYTYGGRTEFAYSGFSPYYGGLHRLDVRTCMWTRLSFHRGPLSVRSERGPTAKMACRMLCYEGRLVLYGGCCTVGSSIGVQPGASYDHGWTNELHMFDLTKSDGTWSSPVITGTRPPPCAVTTFTMVDHHTAVLFGGGLLTDINLFMLDLQAMHWSVISHNGMGPPTSENQGYEAVCLRFAEIQPQLLVVGGVNYNETLHEMWLLDIKSKRWKALHMCLPEQHRHYRNGHCTAAFSLGPGRTKVVVFGGNEFFADTVIFHFGVQPLQELCSREIKSALLQQRNLKPDELVAKLPDFVPTRIKKSVLHSISHTL